MNKSQELNNLIYKPTEIKISKETSEKIKRNKLVEVPSFLGLSKEVSEKMYSEAKEDFRKYLKEKEEKRTTKAKPAEILRIYM